MARFPTLLLLLASFVGCDVPCAPSSDVQIELFAGAGVDAGAATQLVVDLSLDGAVARRATLPLSGSFDRRAFLLQPDTPPANAYTVTVSVQALDGAGRVIASGGASGRVDPNGCNRLEATLTVVTAGDDLASALVDAAVVTPDLARFCGAGAPDEDGDGIPNDCDACPADFDQNAVNSDGDPLPDACDPDTTRAGNVALLFEPFNADSGRWTGGGTFGTSELVVQSTRDPVMITDASDAMPANLRVEVWLSAAYFLTVRGMPIPGDAGVFVGDAADPAQSTAGMACVITHASTGGDSLDLYRYVNGTATVRTTIPLMQPFATTTAYRLRLEERAGAFRCEVVTGEQQPTVLTDTLASPSSYRMALRATATEAHFSAVFAASTLP